MTLYYISTVPEVSEDIDCSTEEVREKILKSP